MTTKTITIMEEAYKALLKEKIDKESFTDVIMRLTKKRGSLMDCFGSWDMSKDEWRKIRKELDEKWNEFNMDVLKGFK